MGSYRGRHTDIFSQCVSLTNSLRMARPFPTYYTQIIAPTPPRTDRVEEAQPGDSRFQQIRFFVLQNLSPAQT